MTRSTALVSRRDNSVMPAGPVIDGSVVDEARRARASKRRSSPPGLTQALCLLIASLVVAGVVVVTIAVVFGSNWPTAVWLTASGCFVLWLLIRGRNRE